MLMPGLDLHCSENNSETWVEVRQEW